MSEKIKSKKPIGFYAVLLSALLCVVTSAAYGIMFSTIKFKEPVFDINICILLVVVGVISGAMVTQKKLARFASVPLCIGTGIALIMFGKMMIWPISDTVYGIEPFPQIASVIICMIAFVATFVVAEISLYTKKI